MFQLTKKPDLKKEFERRKSQTQRILELFYESDKTGKPIYTKDLQLIAYKYSSRLDDLKREGHRWVADYMAPGSYRYTYKGRVSE